MSRSKTHRPRISRELRDYVISVGSELNGSEVRGFHHGLELLTRYIRVLQGTPPCPECGTATEEIPNKYAAFRCRSCEQDFHGYDVLGVENTENARLPPLPKEVEVGFQCDCNEENTADNVGTTGGDSTHTTQSRQDSNGRSDRLEW
jgi:hypothetical protein